MERRNESIKMKKRLGVIGCIVILLLVGSTNIALAYTEIIASTETELSTPGADCVILELIPKYEVVTPNLCFEANGKATTVIYNSRSASIDESYATFAVKNGPYVTNGGAMTSTYSATNANEIKTNLGSEIEVKKGENAFHTSVSGISLAFPGPCLDQEQDYELGLSGSHQVMTDAIFTGKLPFVAYPKEMDGEALNFPPYYEGTTILSYSIDQQCAIATGGEVEHQIATQGGSAAITIITKESEDARPEMAAEISSDQSLWYSGSLSKYGILVADKEMAGASGLLSDGDGYGNIILKSDSYGSGLTQVMGDGPSDDGAEITEGTFSFSTYEGMTAELPLGEANYDYDIYGGASAASTFEGTVGDGEGISTWVQVVEYAEVETGWDVINP
uniref:Uncharacterized protein n=1 Tax=Candidatus Methanophaga sp. ANME-1 ERB7 TaxID=2759913 RepID=A0A7G9Z2K8_9EURY|nr:hypothetical protein ILIMKHIM_00021 [Methanosarcinales archaeon ANME-1 ERB7]